MKDKNFENTMIETDSLKKNLLIYLRKLSIKDLITGTLLKQSRELSRNWAIKLHFLRTPMNNFQENLRHSTEEHDDRFYIYIKKKKEVDEKEVTGTMK